MKTKILILLTALFLSCSTEQEIVDTLTTENSLRTQTDVANFVVGVYGCLSRFTGFKFAYPVVALSADDMYTRTGATFGVRFSTKTPDPAITETSNFWWQMYQAINSTNFLLERLDGLPIDANYRRRIKGEMQFVRAFCYYYMVRMFGPVPLRTTASKLDQDLAVSRNSVEEVYAQIFKDLTEANQTMIPRRSMPASEFGHGTKGSAQAIMASASLTYGNWLELNGKGGEAPRYYTSARSWADSVILSGQYNLIPSYIDLWDVEKENAAYNEIIFAIAFTRDPQVSGAQALGSDHGLQSMPANMPNVGGNGATKAGQGSLRVQPWFAKKFTTGEYAGDFRSEFSILTTYQNNATPARPVVTYPRLKASTTSTELVETQPYMGKFRDGKALDARNAENDLPIIRLAEVFLIKAEAENELNGPTDVALTEFNKVRARARTASGTTRTTPANLTLAGLTKDSFRAKIQDERAIEFLGEGIRWFDLLRGKTPGGKSLYQYQFETFLPTLPKGLPTYNTATNTWGGGELETTAAPAFNVRQLLMPVPLAELSVNAKSTQNPGY